jgi:hypothetical protein
VGVKEPRCAAVKPLHEAIDKLRNLDETDEWHQGFHAALDEALELVADHDCSASIKTALQELKAQGKKTGGSIPYGYQLAADGKTLLERPDEQEVIKIVRELKDKGMSLRGIAKELRKLKIRSREPGRRRRWEFHAKQISRMLKA